MFSKYYTFHRAAQKPPEFLNVVLLSLSVMTIVTVWYNLGFVMAALTVLTDPMNLLTGVTTLLADRISLDVETTHVFLDFFIVLVFLTALMAAMKKIAVSHRHFIKSIIKIICIPLLDSARCEECLLVLY